MKHLAEIDNLLREIIYDDWMTDVEFKEAVDFTLNGFGLTKQKLSDNIETGLQNGYSVKQQINLIKKLIKL